ncbi:MFS transporter [Candidatus Uhrbacteria bacterium]|nr:MFS transporter [Candidatus Uhrbacteria bacterium]
MPQKTIRLYLFFTFLTKFGQSFIFATYTIFLLSRGLNLFEINLVNFVFYTTLFLFEIPTGAIADVFGRKMSFILACLFAAASSLLYAATQSFAGFALAEALGAIGITLASGAFQAWLVDKLKYHDYTEPLGPIFTREHQIGSLALILGAMGGAWLADFHIAWPWIGAGIIALIAGFLATVLMKEEYFVRERFSFSHSIASIKKTIRVSIDYGSKHAVVRFILVMGVIQYITIQAANMQWQPFFAPALPNKTSLGFIFAGISLAAMLGATLSTRIQKIMGSEQRTMILSQCIIGAGILAAALIGSFPVALTVFLVHEIGRGLFAPVKDTYLNKHIPSETRATLISFESMSHHIGGMIGLLASGALAQYYSIPTAWIVSGGFLIVVTLLFIGRVRSAPVL